MIKILLALALVLTVSGCVGLGGRDSYVQTPDGKQYRVRCQSDGKVDFADGTVKLTVDNRGPLGQVWAAGTASLGKIYDRVKGEPEVNP